MTICSPTCSKTNILTINSSASAGIYPITVTATGGGITRKASYFLIIKKEGSEPIRGCTDSTATNYNPEATKDNGSCKYECKIFNFDVPDMMWVGYPRTAEWSTNEVCTTGKITCRLKKDGTDCGDREDLSSDKISLKDDEPNFKPFTIYQPGYYQYEFEACGPNNCDTWGDGSGAGEPTELPIIRAINLPIWWEINPVLPKKDTE
ncbi:MAG: hypothetical protein WC320_00135 [Candidatus Paceibacterota bacterium]|jgi:hypothetical protein